MTTVTTPEGRRFRLSLFDLGLACCAVEFVAAVLREGIATLPVLLAHDDAALMAVLAGDLTSDAALDEALQTLRAHPALALARERMSSYVERAREVALSLPEGAARQALVSLTDYVLARTG